MPRQISIEEAKIEYLKQELARQALDHANHLADIQVEHLRETGNLHEHIRTLELRVQELEKVSTDLPTTHAERVRSS